jgi:Tol biopolymer transport system component
MDQALAWAPGERIIYRSGKLTNFKIFDPETGEESDLIPLESERYTFSPSWSQSGDRVVFFMNRLLGGSQEMKLWVLSITDGEMRPLTDGIYWPVAWSEDDRWIYVMRPPSEEDGTTEIVYVFRISSTGGQAEVHAVLPFPSKNAQNVSITPDGNTIVLLKSDTTSDIWLVEDFDQGIE